MDQACLVAHCLAAATKAAARERLQVGDAVMVFTFSLIDVEVRYPCVGVGPSEDNPADEPSSPTGEDRSQTDDEPTTPAEIESENDEASSSFKSKVTKWCARRNRFIQGSVAVDA